MDWAFIPWRPCADESYLSVPSWESRGKKEFAMDQIRKGRMRLCLWLVATLGLANSGCMLVAAAAGGAAGAAGYSYYKDRNDSNSANVVVSTEPALAPATSSGR
jgi:hypothetical protein